MGENQCPVCLLKTDISDHSPTKQLVRHLHEETAKPCYPTHLGCIQRIIELTKGPLRCPHCYTEIAKDKFLHIVSIAYADDGWNSETITTAAVRKEMWEAVAMEGSAEKAVSKEDILAAALAGRKELVIEQIQQGLVVEKTTTYCHLLWAAAALEEVGIIRSLIKEDKEGQIPQTWLLKAFSHAFESKNREIASIIYAHLLPHLADKAEKIVDDMIEVMEAAGKGKESVIENTIKEWNSYRNERTNFSGSLLCTATKCCRLNILKLLADLGNQISRENVMAACLIALNQNSEEMLRQLLTLWGSQLSYKERIVLLASTDTTLSVEVLEAFLGSTPGKISQLIFLDALILFQRRKSKVKLELVVKHILEYPKGPAVFNKWLRKYVIGNLNLNMPGGIALFNIIVDSGERDKTVKSFCIRAITNAMATVGSNETVERLQRIDGPTRPEDRELVLKRGIQERQREVVEFILRESSRPLVLSPLEIERVRSIPTSEEIAALLKRHYPYPPCSWARFRECCDGLRSWIAGFISLIWGAVRAWCECLLPQPE
jgi:hypothetical protein